jgi:hypothetical protein
MPFNHAEEIKKLDQKTSLLQKAINEAHHGNTKAFEEFLILIHRPGWTTIADIAFVNSHIDSIMNQVRNLNEQVAGFIKAAKLVEVKNVGAAVN